MYCPSPFNMPFAPGGGVDGVCDGPCKLVATQNMKTMGHLPLTMTLLRVSHQYMTHERMLPSIVLVMFEQMATNAHIIVVFNPINDTLSWEHIDQTIEDQQKIERDKHLTTNLNLNNYRISREQWQS